MSAESAPAEVAVYSVGDLVAGLRGLLEDRVGRVWVVGEIGNLRRAASGHSYFTLKDDRAQLRAVLFQGTARRLAYEPEDGLEVLAYGEVTLYEPRGDLQLLVRSLEPRGDGALRLAFEQLRRRLEAEGLFDVARKRALPELPQRIGVVASAASAALQDVIQVTGRRCPAVPLRLAATRVQGAGAEHEIAAALELLATRGEVDVILLVRGGGSLEDLQAFNTEVVARAVAACPVPVVAGVGHEVDTSIADLVADRRAPTPSAAAELVAPDRADLQRLLTRDAARLARAAARRLERAGERLERARRAVGMLSPAARVAARRRRLEGLAPRLVRGGRGATGRDRARLAGLAPALPKALRAELRRGGAQLAESVARLEALSPLGVLGRGYALVRRQRDGSILRSAGDVAPGERIDVRLARGELVATVDRVDPTDSDG